MTTVEMTTGRTRLLQLVSEELTRSLADEEGAMKLVGLGMTSLPPEAVELIRDSVERLSLQQNKLATLPQYFSRLERLRYLDLRDNSFSIFPTVLTEMHNLEILDLSLNSLFELPSDLAGLRQLKVLSLKNNKFEHIPRSILGFDDLRLLELENNPFRQHTKAFLNNIPYKTNTPEWVQEIKQYLYTTQDEVSRIVEQPLYTEEQQPPLTAAQSTFQFHNQPQQPQQPQTQQLQPSLSSTSSSSSSSILQNSRSLERSRSTSESYVSSRAAKRMGFIIKRPNQEHINTTGIIEEDESPASQLQQQSLYIQTQQQQQQQQTLDPRRNRSFSTGTLTPSPDQEERNPLPSRQHSMDNQSVPSSSFGSTSHTRSSSRTESPVVSDKLDSIPEHRSNDYFKRLSTLPEGRFNMTRFKIVDISRKILFAFSEFQATMKKLNTFCSDKQVIIEMVSQLYASKTMIDHLVESLEFTERANEEGMVSIDGILKTVTQTVMNFKKMVDTLTNHYTAYIKNSDVVFVRMLLLSLFMCYSEVYNAYVLLSHDSTHAKNELSSSTLTINTSAANTIGSSSRTAQLPTLRIPEHSNTITQQQLNEYGEVDEKLYESLHNVLQSSNQVYSELNDAISKSAIANAKSDEYHLASSSISKIKELTSTCVLSMDLNKKIKMKMGNQNQGVKSFTLVEKKKFYDEINALLKSIINILASTKAIMNESVILHEVRPSLASLTKATKDVTIMLEVSSYRLINDSFSTSSAIPQSATTMTAPMLSSIPSVMSIPQMNSPLAFATPMPMTTSTNTSTNNPFEASMGAHFSTDGNGNE